MPTNNFYIAIVDANGQIVTPIGVANGSIRNIHRAKRVRLVGANGELYNPMTPEEFKQYLGLSSWTEVDYYSNLPDPSLHTNKIFLVKNDSGFFPFKKKAGFYRSTGSSWQWLGVLTLSSMADVNVVGVQDGQTIKYSANDGGWVLFDPQEKLISGTNIKTINGETILGSGNLSISGSGGGIINIPIYDNGTKTTAFNFDLANGTVQKVTLGASLAFGISNPSDTSKSHFLTIFVHQDGTGGRTWTGVNGTNVDLGGIATSGLLSSSANAIDMFEFIWYAGKWRLINAIFNRS